MSFNNKTFWAELRTGIPVYFIKLLIGNPYKLNKRVTEISCKFLRKKNTDMTKHCH